MSPLDTPISSAKLGLLGDIWCPGCFMTLIFDIDDPGTSCSVDVSLFSKKYSIFWNLLPCCD